MRADLLIHDVTVLDPEGAQPGRAVLVRGGKVAAVVPAGEASAWDCREQVNAGGDLLAPGFIDLHIHGLHRFLADLGGADICYSGPGWTGHLAFIEPDAPEFDAPLEEWKALGPRIVTLSPFTLAQNSLHGTFGKSGDLAAVPPKAATIGPAQVVASKHRRQTIAITVHGTTTSWQRLVGRLVMHGSVTPRVPESICQTLRTDVIVSESNAQDIEPDWNKGY